MSQSSTILALSLAYLGLLFVIAHAGERHAIRWSRGRLGPVIYALSLAIYCTSWTYYGSVGRAVTNGHDFILIYVGPALVIVLAWPLMVRIVAVAKRQNVTSIADFLGARYGRSRAVAVLATLIAVMGAMPYIALQLQAVSFSFEALSGAPIGNGTALGFVPIWEDTALIVTLLMVAFTIVFGVRHVEASEQHRGMMLAIALESLVKLFALLIGGVFVVWWLFDGPAALLSAARDLPAARPMLEPGVSANWLALTVLSGFAFLCLPRQFHVAVVEHDHPNSLGMARWMFPLYLVLINIFVVPVALAGLVLLDPGHTPDFYILTLPLSAGADWLTALIFIGGLSAATSMVAVACMALSGMVSNELVMPWLLRRRQEEGANLGQLGLLVRRLAVVVILLAAYAYYRTIAGLLPLVTIGLISFCAVANFAPPLLIGLYWRKAHRLGVIAGLVGGFAVWFWAILWPTIQPGEAAALPPWGPLAWFDPLIRGFVVGMMVNIALLVLGSWLARPLARDRQQATAFVGEEEVVPRRPQGGAAPTELDQLKELAARFIGPERAEEAFRGLALSGAAALEFTERLLSGTIGAASARVVVTTSRRKSLWIPGGLWMPGSIRDMLDEATAAIRYNADLLRRTLDHMGLGLAVFDSSGKLEVWNERFAILTGLDPDSLAVGVNLATLPAHIPSLAASLGHHRPTMREFKLADGAVTELRVDPLSGGGIVVTANDVTDRVRAAEALRDSERRTRIVTDNVPVLIAYIDRERRYRFTNRPYQAALMVAPGETEGRLVSDVLGEARYQQLKPHIDAALDGRMQVFEIEFPTNDSKIEIARGTYIPHVDESGQVLGFFLLYVDITERRQAEAALRHANESLERRVAQRTAELEAARARAEEANIDKTRFIAAASHDLLQPLHAARLFVAALAERHAEDDLVGKVDLGLSSVEALLDALLDIAKLDAGAIKAEPRSIAVGPLLQSLADAFAPLAARNGMGLRLVSSRAWVQTDPALLRRVLQNYLSNAIRYGRGVTARPRVLMGCRRVGDVLRIEVRDNGPGIAAEQHGAIYQEFIRLRSSQVGGERGLGLGLAIVDRITRMLGHRRDLVSRPGKGAAFSIDLPMAAPDPAAIDDNQRDESRTGLMARAPYVVCIDDEQQVREGMQVLLESWGCDVIVSASAEQALEATANRTTGPDLILIDLHLGDDQPDGLTEIGRLRAVWGPRIPTVLITANRDPALIARARSLGLDVLHKPVKPAKLRALIAQRAAA
ncbi:MAG: PAS domain-containing protein [Rhodospirillaceae bacterium]|nr:PAS domain-containing protein [Rhodospirillaceae bacterium]